MGADHPRTLIGRSALAILVGIGFGQVSGLLVRALLARAVSPDELGELFLATAVVTLAGGLASFGVRPALARGIPEALEHSGRDAAAAQARTSLRLTWITGGVALVLLLLGATVLWLGERRSLALILAGLSPMALAVPVGIAAWGISQGWGDSRGRAFIREAGGGLLRLAMVWAAAAAGAGVALLSVFYGLAFLIADVALLGYVLRRGWAGQASTPTDRAFLRSLSPWAAHTLLVRTSGAVDMLLLGVIVSPSALAYYGVARTVRVALQQISGAVAHRLVPLAALAGARRDRESLRAGFVESRRLLCGFTWPAASVCLLYPEALLTWAFGAEYAAGAIPLRIFVAALMLTAFLGQTVQMLHALNRTRAILILTFGRVVLESVLLLVLAPRYGIGGAAVALFVSDFLKRGVALILVRPLLKPLFDARSLLWLVALVLPAALAAAAAAWLDLRPALAVPAVAAIAALPLLRDLVPLLRHGGVPRLFPRR